MFKIKFNQKVAKDLILVFAALSAFSFISCKKGSKSNSAGPSQPQVQESAPNTPAKLKKLSTETKAYLEGKNIIVILGYGYNDTTNVENLTKILDENFGVETEENPALISILVYPDDFTVSGKTRVSSLANKVEDKNLAGMVILGSPEGMHIALSKIQDKAEDGKIPYPVFTFFSQDDVLGTESTSDFVLDYAQKTNPLENEATDFIPDFDATPILTNAISAMLELREPLKADKNLLPFVQKLLEKNRTVTHYIDGETGLQSINHFIFE